MLRLSKIDAMIRLSLNTKQVNLNVGEWGGDLQINMKGKFLDWGGPSQC